MHVHADNDAQGPDQDDYLVSRPRAWFAFAMILILMLFDYIDRHIIVSLFPPLKEAWGLSDKQLGGLVSVISVVVALGGLPVALLADRFGRVKSIVVMATVWSVATISCMFARNYAQLFAARAMVGVGETGYGSVGAALISGLFPRRLRATLLGAFMAAGSTGAVLGVVLGGYIADHWGWHAAFGAVGIPGLIFALLFIFVPDYKAPALSTDRDCGLRTQSKQIWAALTCAPTVWWTCLGGAFQLIVVSTVWSWLPSYFNRFHGYSATDAARHAALVVLCGALGAVLWGFVADRVGKNHPRRRLLMVSVLTVATFAVLVAAFTVELAPKPQFALILLGGLLMTCSVGTTASTVMDVIHPAIRSTGAAVLSLFQNLFGLAIGPVVGGMVSDVWGLHTALAVMPAFGLLATWAFWRASRTYESDLKAVVHVPLSAAKPVAIKPAVVASATS